MAHLVYESNLNASLEELIDQARDQLVFFSPYFKLHDRLRDRLKLRKEDYKLRIAIVFGKNEEDPSKSLNKDDFEFLKSFPNIIIKYEKRLHAKYYANEKVGLITSLNLHLFSQNNNIEVGVQFKTKNLLKSLSDQALGGLTSILSDTEDIATEAGDFFWKVFQNAETVFENEPVFESKMLGLQKKYTHSEVLKDNTDQFFKTGFKEPAPRQQNRNEYYKNTNNTQAATVTYNAPQSGYCIRTGTPIPFNPAKPLSYDAYQSWAQYENPDYQERYCHGCGKSWRTSVRSPLCADCLNKTMN